MQNKTLSPADDDPMTEISEAQPPSNSQEQVSCRSCLYTGVFTCWGLSGYFVYLAFEEDGNPTMTKQQTRVGSGDKKTTVSQGSKSFQKSIETSFITFMQGHPVAKRNRPFLFALSAFCAGSGACRLYLN